MKFEMAQQVANAVLYEGYLLYPYRASATKNQLRWQFGVVMPRDYSENGAGEPWVTQTECLVEPGDRPEFDLRLRFLQIQARSVEQTAPGTSDGFVPVDRLEVEGQELFAWDEGVEREIDQTAIDLGEICRAEKVFPFDVPAGRDIEAVTAASGIVNGRVVRERFPISGVIRVSGERRGSLIKLRIRVENWTPWAGAENNRARALRHALAGAHVILAVRDGALLSLLDPPEFARAATASCENLHTWPVLVGTEGERDVMLSSPIILYDYPCVAAESPGDMYDATEIDEILALRTMTLTDDEKSAARATDTRAAAIIDRVDSLPGEVLERLHGAVRYLRKSAAKPENQTDTVPWWNPAADDSVSPETDHVQIDGVAVAKGSRVRLRPGLRRADAQDLFLQGRVATVEAVFSDVDDKQYLAVALADDPATELHRWHGRYLYFYPDEVEPLKER